MFLTQKKRVDIPATVKMLFFSTYYSLDASRFTLFNILHKTPMINFMSSYFCHIYSLYVSKQVLTLTHLRKANCLGTMCVNILNNSQNQSIKLLSNSNNFLTSVL